MRLDLEEKVMKNGQECWAKTLLTTNSYLDAICGAIDKMVASSCVESASFGADTISIANKVIALSERKKFFVNTRVLINNVLNNIPKQSAKILTLRYVDHMKSDLICNLLNMPQRTYFRKISKAICDFAFELKKLGFDEEKLFLMFKNELWILEIFDTYAKRQMPAIETKNLLSMAILSLKQRINFAYC